MANNISWIINKFKKVYKFKSLKGLLN
jgi:hypothetical protein